MRLIQCIAIFLVCSAFFGCSFGIGGRQVSISRRQYDGFDMSLLNADYDADAFYVRTINMSGASVRLMGIQPESVEFWFESGEAEIACINVGNAKHNFIFVVKDGNDCYVAQIISDWSHLSTEPQGEWLPERQDLKDAMAGKRNDIRFTKVESDRIYVSEELCASMKRRGDVPRELVPLEAHVFQRTTVAPPNRRDR